jgi:hypothetical protein
MKDLRYPIGKFERRDELNATERVAMIDVIAAAPAHMRNAVAGVGDSQLDTPYREGGWTVRQVVHHVPDSHLNAYTRLKLALTENDPVIRPYDEALWSELPDSRDTPIEVSLTLLESLHARWVTLFRALAPDDFRRTLRHPDHPGILTVDWLVAMYAWHSRHHVAHITSLRDRMQW